MYSQCSFEVVINGYGDNITNFCEDFLEDDTTLLEFCMDDINNEHKYIRYASYGFCKNNLQKLIGLIQNLSAKYELNLEFVSTELDNNIYEHIVIDNGTVLLNDRKDLLTSRDFDILESFTTDDSYWDYIDDVISAKYSILNKGIEKCSNSPFIILTGYKSKELISEIKKLNEDVEIMVTYTTRPPRPDEVNGVDYNFISEEEFKKNIDDGFFMEHIEMNGFLYGSAKPGMLSNKTRIINLDVRGADKFKQVYPNVTTVFVIPASMKELINLDADKFSNAYFEIKYSFDYEYLIVNRDVKKAASELDNIIKASRNKFDSNLIGELIYVR